MQNQKIQLTVQCKHNTMIAILDMTLKIALIMTTVIAYVKNITEYTSLIFLITYWLTYILKYLCETRIYQMNDELYLKYSFSNEEPIKINVENCLKKRNNMTITWEIDGDEYITNIPENMR